MKRKAKSGIMLTLLLIGMLTLAFNIEPVKATGTIYIRPDGSIDPQTAPIQRDGDVYRFTGNIFYDTIVIERDNIVVDGATYAPQGYEMGRLQPAGIFLSGRSNVTIKDVEITGFYYGIWLYNSSNCSISGNNITNNALGVWCRYSSNIRINGNNITNIYEGIDVEKSSSNRITRNNIADNRFGITFFYSSDNTMTENNVTSNKEAGICLSYSSNNVLRGNVMAGNKYNFDVTGQELSHFINDVDASNTIDGRPVIYLINEQNLIIDPQAYPTIGYLAVINSTNIIVRHLNMKNNGQGILLASTKNSLIQNVTVTNNVFGIWLINFSNSSITGNYIANNFEGIMLRDCSSNSMTGSNIGNNNYGVTFENSSNNKIFHNNFHSINQVLSLDSMNVWDDGYASGGNYWSDYTNRYPLAKELDDSGIWDRPYVIDENNQDSYPLMEPWTPPPSIPTTIDELKTKIEELGSEGEIGNQGIVNSLIAKLNTVQNLVDKGKMDEAKTILEEDFIPQVQNLSGIHITVEAADILIKSAEYMLSHL